MFRHLNLGLVAFALASAQQPVGSPSFEVASLKLASDTSPVPFDNPQMEMRFRFQGGPGTPSPERVNYRGVTLSMLIRRAYDVESYQIVGPRWMDGQRYSITAKVPTRTTAEECKLMLQNLLAERFHLRQHAEARPFRVFQLIVSKDGPKFGSGEAIAVSEGQDRRAVALRVVGEQQKALQGLRFTPTQSFFVTNASMAQFASRLSQYLDRPTIDKTGLSGDHSLSLSWVGDRGAGVERPDGPSLVEALREQLGLELRQATQDLRVIVVDAAERTPDEN